MQNNKNKRTQRGYSVTDPVHTALQAMAVADGQTIANELESAVLALIGQRIASGKPVSLEMLNLYLLSTGVQLVVLFFVRRLILLSVVWL